MAASRGAAGVRYRFARPHASAAVTVSKNDCHGVCPRAEECSALSRNLNAGLTVVSGCLVYPQKSDKIAQTFRRRARLRAAAIRCRPLLGKAGIAIVSDRKLVAMQAYVDSSDPFAEVAITNPNVYILHVQTVRPEPTPCRKPSARRPRHRLPNETTAFLRMVPHLALCADVIVNCDRVGVPSLGVLNRIKYVFLGHGHGTVASLVRRPVADTD